MDFRQNRRNRTPIDINLIPMIDILLVLLIFFIVTTTFTHEAGLNINLPEAAKGQSSPTQPNAKVFTLFIDKQGSYFISTTENPDDARKLDAENLKQELQSVIGQALETPMAIKADGKTPHQAVVKALDIAGQIGIKHIGIVTEEPEAEK
jgi:biopolymer transport protein ExbD